jgi:glyoxylase-like metal-dependent hydrolase (beta-lactamase superfamily II)
MLKQVAEGVLTHESSFVRFNTTVVQGGDGVLLVDPGVLETELVGLADDLLELDQPVLAGISTHPHWDHLLWHSRLGDAPRFGTARCLAAVQTLFQNPNWKDTVGMLPPDITGHVPLDLFGLLIGLPEGTEMIPWDGPEIRVLEHQAHAPGHAALLIEERKVLIAADTLSDVLFPLLDFRADDPIGDYLAALELLEGVVGKVDVFIPGHGSTGGADEMRARIAQDRAYLYALRDGAVVDDPRLGPSAPLPGLSVVHEGQVQRLAQKREQSAPG